MATGDTPLMCHRVAFIPLVEQPSVTPTSTSPPKRVPSAANNAGVRGAEEATRAVAEEADADGSGSVEYDVFIRMARGAGSNGSGNGGDSDGDGHEEQRVFPARMEAVECGGAVLSLSISRDDRFVMVNVRPFMVCAIDGVLGRLCVPFFFFLCETHRHLAYISGAGLDGLQPIGWRTSLCQSWNYP